MSLQKDPDPVDRLRPLFERLRDAEAARVPPLARVLGRAPGRPRLVATRAFVRRLGVASGVLALAVVATWWTIPARAPERQVASTDVALLYWRSPTAALLTSERDCMSDAYDDAVAAVGRGKAEGR